jgi:hypothetical protein
MDTEIKKFVAEDASEDGADTNEPIEPVDAPLGDTDDGVDVEDEGLEIFEEEKE